MLRLFALAALLLFPVTDSAFALVTVSCGQSLRSLVRTENQPTTTSSTTFLNIVKVTLGPAGLPPETRCLKATFTAEASCAGPEEIEDLCYVRMLVNGVEMHPRAQMDQILASEDPTPSAHGFKWAFPIDPNIQNLIILKKRVGDPATSFTIDDWTLDLEFFTP